MKDLKTLADRLRYAMEVLPPKKIKGVDLARAVGVKPPSVSDWLSGKSKTMEGENLLKAAKFLGVNPVWLATGKNESTLSHEKNNESVKIQTTKLENTPNLQKLYLLDSRIRQLTDEEKLTKDQIKIINEMIENINNIINTWVDY
ncbi:TPA: helix-turn-helix transcriptional regulator [Acinetobacter baumannii]|nr:helix-turn-helix transcriptional regulator [Acinetobacter baumannii]